jgi:DNA polymerase III subunit delta'
VPFSRIVGHRRLIALLSRAVARGTLPPATLLAGPAGVGKRRAAIAIAQALNCLNPRTSPELDRDACGECAACRRIERGVHPDVIVLAPGDTGTIKIDDVREVVSKAGFRPFEARRRVVIIDEADALVDAAQNALLKTLEEPPSASIFILVSSMPDALLSTVRSRCPRLRFGPLTAGEVADILIRDHGYDESEARAAAADADGSVGRALSAESADLADARSSATRLLEHAARATDPARRLDAARELTGAKSTPAAERDQLAACLRSLSSLLRDLGILASSVDAGALANADLRSELERLGRVYDSDRTVTAYTAVDQALAALERNASPKVVADWLVLQL